MQNMLASKFSVYQNGKQWETSLESDFPFIIAILIADKIMYLFFVCVLH